MADTGNKPLVFAKNAVKLEKPVSESTPWKLFIVDDDEEIHSVTKMALTGFIFGGKRLEFLHAYSGAEAKVIFENTSDIAIVLLDVVMESDSAGLDVVKYVRESLGNQLTRIVLRTGQPGQAPEKHVISNYDINDYKEKTELTAQKLFTTVSASLRGYRDMVALEESRDGLKKIIDASANLFSLSSMQQFAEGALAQMLSMLHIKDNGSFYGAEMDSLAACKNGPKFRIVAGTGNYAPLGKESLKLPNIPIKVIDHLTEAAHGTGHVFKDDHIVSYHKGPGGHENLLYVSGELDHNGLDKSLIELYARNVGIAFENIELHSQLEETQREIVYRLGEAVETRSMETGNHLKRVSEIVKLLALEFGMTATEAEQLKYASPLHDVGKIGIPDAVLKKPGKLDPEEWEVMKTHALLGHKMLESSEKPILRAGAIIALEHHEKWDGSGYPYGKQGEDIHIFGRITALADVYDALASDRCYKKAWALGDIYTHIKSQSGKHFQPELVKTLTLNLDKVENIMMTYADKFESQSRS